MLSLRIVLHSLRMVFGNFADALRISLVLTLLSYALSTWATAQLPRPDPTAEMQTADPGAVGALLISLVINAILGAWVAVRWHRYVLKQEYPSGFVPGWDGQLVLGYIGRLLLVGLVLAMVSVGGSVVLVLVVSALGPAGWMAGGVLLAFAVFYVSLRVSLILPAAALGQTMGIRDSWQHTAPLAADIAGVVLIALILAGPLSFLVVPGAVGLALGFVLNWIYVMFSASLLTTLYGITVEQRSLS